MLGDARLFHVNVNVSDLERARAFYVDGLGFDLGARTTPETDQDGAAFGLDRARWDAVILTGRKGFEGSALDVLEWSTPPAFGAPPAGPTATGWQRLGIGVPDLAATMDALVAAGGELWGAPLVHSSAAAPEVHLVHASDPDGVALEIFEGRGPQLAFVSVVSADVARSRSWYEALGFECVGSFPSAGDDGAALRVDGAYSFTEHLMRPPGGGEAAIMLVGFDEPRATVAPPRAANELGMWRVAFLVSELDAKVAALEAAGIGLLSPVAALAMGPGLPELRFVCFRGPDGEVLELIETP